VYRFSSKECHVKSGLYYYLYRWYSPELHRWITRDPINERGGVHLYRFVFNRPVHLQDPYGESALPFPLTSVPPNTPPRPKPTPQSIEELQQQIQEIWEKLPYTPQNVASADANCTRGGTVNTGNNLPMYPPSGPGTPCQPGTTPPGPWKESSQVVECPCTGTVNCREREECVFTGMGANGTPVGTMQNQVDCTCPENIIL